MGIATSAASLDLLLTGWVYFNYRLDIGGYQFLEHIEWVPQLGISYYVGADGISLPMLLLGAIVTFCGVLVSWRVDERKREYFAFMMFLAGSVQGVFAALDLFMLFFFFELAVFPKYLMIIIWGSPKTREYGGMKLTLYLFIGSMLALLGALAVYSGSGLRTFDMLQLEKAGFSVDFQRWWFVALFLGFGILSGIFPLHSWAPDGHVAAPTAISMLLAGVEMKVGAYAALRVAIVLLPEGARWWAPWILVLATINVVYGALIALIQSDFKYVIGFSSVSHMGLVMLGFASLNREGLTGAGLQMFSHGIMTALFFAIVGMVYDRTHTREISQLGGLFKLMPWAGTGFIVAGLVSMGMPGFSGFIAEFPIMMGVWQAAPWAAMIAVLGVLITAAYILLVVRRVFFGQANAEYASLNLNIHVQDKIVIALLVCVIILLGFFPSLMSPLIQSGMDRVLTLVGGA
ncbi:MAG: NADH-quinone oxidoreductase subunit M [Anaerolineae bacterium]|nr:NADH-quinone oxidoreductase subunit M [Anaerolineae bacterium]